VAIVLVVLKLHGWLHGVVELPKKEEGVELGNHICCLEASEGGGGAHLLFDHNTSQLWYGLVI
jgi:hypothetical protein